MHFACGVGSPFNCFVFLSLAAFRQILWLLGHTRRPSWPAFLPVGYVLSYPLLPQLAFHGGLGQPRWQIGHGFRMNSAR